MPPAREWVPLVTAQIFSVSFSLLAGVTAVALFAFAMRAYNRNRDPAFAFLAGAFTVFALKSFLVAYSLYTDLIQHETLEVIDTVGDLSTILLITFPILWPNR